MTSMLSAPSYLTSTVPSTVAASGLPLPSAIASAATVKEVPPLVSPQPLEPDTKVQAYAALEFPSFTFYIQTLSVVIGRRPPTILPTSALPALQGQATLDVLPSKPNGFNQHVKTEDSYFSPRLAPVSSPRLAPLSATRSTSPGDDEAALETDGREDSVKLEAKANGDCQEKLAVPKAEDEDAAIQVDVDLGPIKAVSRHHARLFFNQQWGQWALEVKGRNGAVIDNRWRSRNEVVMLNHRTKIQIAERIFYFVLPESVVRQQNMYSKSLSDTSSDGEVDISTDDLESEEEAAPQLQHEDEIEIFELEPAVSAAGRVQRKRSVANKYLDDPPSPPKQPSKPAAKLPKMISVPMQPPKPKPPPKRSNKGKSRILEEGADEVERNKADNVYTIYPLRVPSNGHVGSANKPPYSFPSLIGQTMHYNAGKKLTSAIICEWIANIYPWYAANRDKVGWQNSIQQHLSTNAAFVKTPRRSDEPGKGNYWVLDASKGLVFDGISDDEDEDAPPRAAPHVPVQKKAAARAAAPTAQPAQGTASAPPKPVPKLQVKQPSKPAASAKTASPAASSSAVPAGATPAASTASSAPAAAVNPVKIVVGAVPEGYKRTAPAKANAPADPAVAALLKDPPIVVWEGAMILSPAIFGQMKAEQIASLSKLGGPKALSILQSYIVQHLKEKMKKMAKTTPAGTPPAPAPSVKRKADDVPAHAQPAAKKTAV